MIDVSPLYSLKSDKKTSEVPRQPASQPSIPCIRLAMNINLFFDLKVTF